MHCGNRVGRVSNVASPKRAGPASPGRLCTQILGDTESGNVCRRDLFSALPTPTCVHVPQEQFQIVCCFETHVAFAQLLMPQWWSPHERIFAKLMSACQLGRLQSFCGRNGANFVSPAVCLSMYCGAAITNPSTQTADATIAFAHLFLVHENVCCCVSSTHVTCSTRVFFAIETMQRSHFHWSAIAPHSPASQKKTSLGAVLKHVMSFGGVVTQTHI